MAAIATAFVRIRPDVSGFRNETEKQISGDLDRTGTNAGRLFGQSFNKSLTDSLRGTGSNLAQQLNRDLAKGLGNARIKVDADTKAAESQLGSVNDKVRSVDGKTARVNVKADTDTSGIDKATRAMSTAGSAAGVLGLAMSALGFAASGGAALIGAAATAIASVGLASTAALPALVGAVGALGAVKGALSGPLSAFKAYTAEQDAAASSSAGLASKSNALKGAQEALADAQVSGARQVESARESLASANERARAADERVAVGARDLAAAYDEARRSLEDLNESASDRARDVEGSEIALARARERAAKVGKDGTSSDLDRRDAAYDVKVAEDRLADSIRDRDRAQTDANKANQSGVKGMPQVVAANKALADAQRDRQAAAAGVASAERDLGRAQADAAKQTQRARDAVAAASVAMAAGSSQSSKYAAAMAKLSPAGQAFVRALIGVNAEIAKVRKRLEAAVLPGFTSFLLSAQTRTGLFADAMVGLGSSIGDTARDLGDFVESSRFGDRMKTMLDGAQRGFDDLLSAVVPITQAILDIGAAATPTFERFAGWVSDIASRFSLWIDAKDRTGELQAAINKAADELANWGAAIRDVFVGVFNIFATGNENVGSFSEKAATAAAKFREWTEVNTDKIQAFFDKLRGVDWAQIAVGSAALLGLSKAAGALGAVSGIGSVLGSLAATGPLGLAVIGVGALAVGIGTLIASSDRLRSKVKDEFGPLVSEWYGWFKDKILPPVKEAAENLIPKLQTAIGNLADGFKNIFADNKDDAEDFADSLPGIASAIGDITVAVTGAFSALSNFYGVITTLTGGSWGWLDEIAAGFGKVGDAAVWLWKEAIVPAWNAIVSALGAAWAWIRDNVFQPIWAFLKSTLGPVFQWLYDNVISPVWTGIKLAIQVAWKLIEVVFKLIEIGVRVVAGIFLWLYENAVKPAWEGIKTAISAAWNWLKQNVFDPIWNVLKATLGPVFTWLWQNAIKPAWDGIKTVLSAGWNFIRDNIFNPLANFVTKTIPNAFTTAVTAIGKAWDKVKDVAKIPVKFIIQTVINDGLIAGVNWIASKVGASRITPVPLPKGLATGGILPGYTPGKDVHRFVSPTGGALDLSGGEAIMRPEFVRAVGAGTVHAMNALAKSGGAPAIRDFMSQIGGDAGSPIGPAGIDRVLRGGSRWTRKPDLGGFADGGIIGALSKPWNAAKKLWDIGTDPAGLLATGANKLIAKIPGVGAMKDVGVASSKKAVTGVVNWVKAKVAPFIDQLTGVGSALGKVAIPASLLGRVQTAQTWLKRMEGTRYSYGGFGPSGFDCSAAVSAVYNIMKGQQPFGGVRFTTHNEGNYMTERGPGVLTAGWINGGVDVAHTSGIIGGLAFEQTPPGLLVGNVRSPVSRFPNIGHPKGLATGGILPAKLFDTGGRWEPGTVGINLSGRTEHVSSPDDMDDVKNLLRQLISVAERIGGDVGRELSGMGRQALVAARSK